jgi:nucleotide-binding universal stress UspA family protein
MRKRAESYGETPMKPFKKILVPLDFSPCSAEAIKAAGDVAERYGAEVCLLHVYEPINYGPPNNYPFYVPGQLENILAECEKRLSDSKQQAQAAGIANAQTQLRQGIPATEIVEFAKTHGFDLIVMGTHGRTGFQHALVGSVAEKVLRRAPGAVLTVRAAPQS